MREHGSRQVLLGPKVEQDLRFRAFRFFGFRVMCGNHQRSSRKERVI